MMDHFCLCLIIACFCHVPYVRAQWILDHRCTSNRRLELLHFHVIAGGTEDQRLLGAGSDLLDIDHKLNKPGNNETENHTQDVEKVYWYSNLRGKAHYANSARTAEKKVYIQNRRRVDEEDTAAFMLRMHWQQGYCWQGMMMLSCGADMRHDGVRVASCHPLISFFADSIHVIVFLQVRRVDRAGVVYDLRSR
jgi:hypothetical protein